MANLSAAIASKLIQCWQREKTSGWRYVCGKEKVIASCEAVSEASANKNAMADREDINPENVGGKYYVDSQCIDCDLCRETAPANFQRSDDEGYSYVYKQPTTEEEIEQCVEAMEGCPVEAIGDDGEDS